MLREDIPVWFAWLDKHQTDIDQLWYDPLLGGPQITPETDTDPMLRMQRALLSLRPDAIATTHTHVLIIEVTTIARHRAIGQLITYSALWTADHPIDLPTRLILVCNYISDDYITAAQAASIEVHNVSDYI